MTHRERFRWLTPALLGALGAACAEPGRLEIESKTEAIKDGTFDYDADYAVHISGPDGLCTGVLVTPRWVLTANHCITGFTAAIIGDAVVNHKQADLEITVIPKNSASDSQGTDFNHTNLISGDVKVMKNGPMELGPGDGYDDASRDLALIRLDTAVPLSLAKPKHPPILGVGTCELDDDFTGTIVGFAGTDSRRSNTDSGWERDTDPSLGDVYLNEWVLPVPMFADPATVSFGMLIGFFGSPSIYQGMEPGDSGGPLVQGDKLCGVASGTEVYGTFRGPVCGPTLLCLTIGNIYAAVDSPQAIAFFEANIIADDSHNVPVFEGECSVGPVADSDGDGRWDGCDVCPNSANNNDSDTDGVCDTDDNCPLVPNGLNLDSDGDGFGDACDPCPNDATSDPTFDLFGDFDSDGVCDSADNCRTIANGDQHNSNLAWELIHTPSDLRGDACEPVPQPRIDVILDEIVVGSADQPGGIEFHDETQESFDLTASSSKGPSFGLTQYTVAVPFKNPRTEACGPACVGFTEFRFCQPGPNDSPPFCDTVAALDEAQIHPEYNSADDELPSDPWHRISLDFGAGPTARGTALGLDYDDSVTNATWLYNTDADYWIANGNVAVPEHASFDPGLKGTDLKGYLWAHVKTKVGATTNVGTGLHGAHLANALVPIDVRNTYTVTGDSTIPEYWWEEKLMQWLPRWPEALLNRFAIDDMVFELSAMKKAGHVSSRAFEALSGNLTWATPLAALDNADQSSPIALGINGDGSVGEALFVGAGGVALMTSEEAGVALDREAPPTRLTGARGVYSRRLSRVFVVGVSSGQYQLWSKSLARGAEWARLASRFELADVISMTVSAASGQLFLVDVTKANVARIVVVDVDSSDAREAHRFERRGGKGLVVLGPTLDGGLLVSSKTGSGFGAATLSYRDGQLTPSLSFAGEDELAHPLIDSDKGLIGAFGSKGGEVTGRVVSSSGKATWKSVEQLFR